ncbi:HAMP domain-containing sensor histidine kinase [Paucibacter sp. APW11]|uniref:histidine kinase n=1 Tax=Roseateles aquae TaxID=3077235 RepID=A0ABU3PC85_9BURK|nr:HAMP domain-containing sensor histidine kinase [Paucibacter sp. APW11]MDT9000186.1 HAMP domain-containing sensor histidine kinase [Paucibacter sp. APW11]
MADPDALATGPDALIDQQLLALLQQTAGAHGLAYFRLLCRTLAQQLGCETALLARRDSTAEGRSTLRALVVWQVQDWLLDEQQPLEAELADRLDDICCERIADLLPGELPAVPRQIVAVQLRDGNAHSLGLLLVASSSALPDAPAVQALLRRLTERCAAELMLVNAGAREQELLGQQGALQLLATGRMIEQERLAALGSLVIGMAQDVGTPMGVAVTAASGLEEFSRQLSQLLQRDTVSRQELQALAARMSEATTLIGGHLRRAADLLAGFKSYAVDQSSDTAVPLDLPDYLHTVARVHSSLLKSSKIRIDWQLPERVPAVMRAGLLSLLLSKLLLNAVQHAFEGIKDRQIRIALSVTEGRARIVFRDNGRGISAPLRKHLQHLLHQHAGAAEGPGMGLGLVDQLARSLGGELALDETEGPGLGFIIELPLAPAALR